MFKVGRLLPSFSPRSTAMLLGCGVLALSLLACALGPAISKEPGTSSGGTQPPAVESNTSGGSNEGQPTTGDATNNMGIVSGVLYTRQDTYDPSIGSAFAFSSGTGMATYYQFWTPGGCEVDLSQKSSMHYEYKNGLLTLPNMDPLPVTGDPSSFTVNLQGGTSGASQGGVSGPNMVVGNGINGTYTKTDCPAP